LGAFDKGTLPKDVAAGQTIGYASILTSHVFQSSITDVRYAVFGTYRNSLDPEEDSILLREFAVNVVAMDGPSVILFSGDGRFLYVSCVYSRSIITFSRSSTTGLIGFDGNLSLVTPWSSSPVTDTDPEESRLAKELFGYPVRGVTSMVFDSSETHVYATNFLDGAVVVLKRNLMTGRLSVLQVISNGMEHRGLSVTGLIGAHGLSLSTTEERVYVTAYVDQAVSTFRRLNDGTLEFRDRMKNGERALWDFKDSAAALGLAQAWDEGEYPMRLGGNNEDWSFTARASKHFAIDGTHYLVVAAGDVNPIAQNGAAVVYRFSEATSTFQWLQTTVNDPGASSVVYFRIKTAGLPDKHFFAVGNSRNRGSTTGRVNIYRFNDQTGRFDYDRYLNLAPDEVNPTLFPSDLVHFDMEGEQYLAVSNLWDGTTEFVRSYIYRWNPGRVRDPGSGIHIDIGFEPWQLIQTSGAVSVDFWTDLESGVSLLVFTNANFNAQVVDIFKFNPDVQAFEPMQSIPAAYASSSRLFAIPEFGVFLAIARRQSRPIIDVVDLAAYDEASQIYKWDSETMSFEPFQELGSKFKSVADLDASPDDVLRFCYPNCVPSDDSVSSPVNYLRGATSISAFQSEGEHYLVISQSVCGLTDGQFDCLIASQPKSAILHFNKLNQSFGEAMTMTDKDSVELYGHPVRLEDQPYHQTAIRISAGRALSSEYFEINEHKFLVVCSNTKGALAYRWEFSRVEGLRGGVDLVANTEDSKVYSVSAIDASINQFSRTYLFDKLGQVLSTCWDTCLRFVNSFSEKSASMSPVQEQLVLGLRGARTVELIHSSGQLVVHGGLPRDELMCGHFPPVSADPNSVVGSPAQCQQLSFSLTTLFTDNPGLFARQPTIDGRGGLSFVVAPFQVGRAYIQSDLVDAEAMMGAPPTVTRFLSIEVLPVNDAPFFSAYDVIANDRGPGEVQELVFAINVSAGQNEDDDQTIQWVYTYDNQFLLAGPPVFDVIQLEGRLAGVVRVRTNSIAGVSTFRVRLQDDGPTDVTTGDVGTSEEQVFRLLVRTRNFRPTFQMLESIFLEANSGPQVIESFATDMSPGPAFESNQQLTFSLDSVRRATGNNEEVGLFTDFDLDMNGTLRFDVFPDFEGIFSVFVRLTDNGGSNFGGTDNSVQSFLFSITPEFAATERIVELMLDEAGEEPVPGCFDVFNASLDETQIAALNVSFRITSVTNVALFADAPRIDQTGTVCFTQAPYQHGTSQIQAIMEQGDLILEDNTLVVEIRSLNNQPSFDVPEFLNVVESTSDFLLPGFVENITTGPVNEGDQLLTFLVQTISTEQNLFSSEPSIDADGTLRFHVVNGGYGVANVLLRIVDNGSGESTGTPVSKGFVLRIFPTPVISSVSPRISSTRGGSSLTVRGRHFGSLLSRGYTAETYGDFAVYVGGAQCLNTTFFSDEMVTCVSPPGIGAAWVSFNISDGGLSRSGVREAGVAYPLALYGGVEAGAGSSGGFLGFGPTSALAGTVDQPSASLQTAEDLGLTAAVQALVWANERVYVGGNFLRAGNLQGGVQGVGHVVSWDGVRVHRLGLGLDGGVNTLVYWQGLVVAGGTFSTALQRAGNPRLGTGGLAAWNETAQQWSMVGGARVNGVVMACLAVGRRLYVGGLFDSVGAVSTNGLAVLEDGVWSSVGGGVLGGTVYSIFEQHGHLYIGGTFSRVGSVPIGRLARWDGRQWLSLGELEGEVRAISAVGEYIFVGGSFKTIDGKPMNNVAVLYSGQWSSLNGGLNGPVHALQDVASCMHIGGVFSGPAVPTQSGTGPGRYITRWCLDSLDSQDGPVFADFQGFPGLGPVRAIVPVVHDVDPSFAPVSGTCAAI